ncbi:DUF6221 family protein [Streptomyces malaysiensis]|uniref:DUF6221 family protein n=1 Tax=Streptomyces malaysiensis subsp. samsunensis TaxID=459658 RepID=A0A9X2LYC4_STRMQ|nr:DUF6221 family protein [Streptomyces samsunensis]MCQ8831741.1 DUF6221 family protein [Streptomyces samsunensis]
MADLHAWTLQQISKREATALAATEGPWVRWADQEVIPGWDGFIMIGDDAADGEECNPVAKVNIVEDCEHITLNDPASVLRRCAADRKLIGDVVAERHILVEDCWYTCAAATEERDGGENCDDERRGGACDCGRDARVERRLRIVAEGYGWTESSDG